jgi:hypothetical protein
MLVLTIAPDAAQFAAEPSARPAPPPKSLEPLAAGIALYPDFVVDLILDAVQHPDDLRAAAAGKDGPFAASVRHLQASPDLLQHLARHSALASCLARAARTQLADVWAAIEHVRALHETFEAQQAVQAARAHAVATPGAQDGTMPNFGVQTSEFIAGLVSGGAVDHFRDTYSAACGPADNLAIVEGTDAAAHVHGQVNASFISGDQNLSTRRLAEEMAVGNQALSAGWSRLDQRLRELILIPSCPRESNGRSGDRQDIAGYQ